MISISDQKTLFTNALDEPSSLPNALHTRSSQTKISQVNDLYQHKFIAPTKHTDDTTDNQAWLEELPPLHAAEQYIAIDINPSTLRRLIKDNTIKLEDIHSNSAHTNQLIKQFLIESIKD